MERSGVLAWSKVSPDHILNESALRLVSSFIYGGVALRWRYPSQNAKVSPRSVVYSICMPCRVLYTVVEGRREGPREAGKRSRLFEDRGTKPKREKRS